MFKTTNTWIQFFEAKNVYFKRLKYYSFTNS